MSSNRFLRALVALGFVVSCISAQAQVGSGAVSYNGGATEDFDALASSGLSSTLPSGWYFAETGSGANASYAADDGSVISGNTYSYGTGTSSERALGTLQSGSVTSTIGVQLRNDTGSTVSSILVSYVGEQWRRGNSATGDRLDAQFSVNATSINDAAATWVHIDALDFSSPVITGSLIALDGNAAANRTAVSATLSGLTLAPNATIWLRWLDLNASGNDDGLAIDDVVFGTPVDLPPFVASSAPAAGAADVPVDTTISITFSEPVDASGAWFSLNCGSGTPTLTASASPATTYTLTPSGPIPYGRICNLFIEASLVTDRDGPADAMEFNETIQFETVVDNPPEVIATTPENLAVDVARAANLTVTFSEPVDAPASAFAILCPDTDLISLAFLASSEDDVVFVLDPSSDLPASTPCRLYVDNLQVLDRDGVAQNPDLDTRVGFTTAALAPPAVIATVPAKDATNFPAAGDLQVEFDQTVNLDAGAFNLACAQSTGIALGHASNGSSFTIDTGTTLVEGDSCTLTIVADAVTSGDDLNPVADEIVDFVVATSGAGGYYSQVNTSTSAQLRCSLHETIRGHTTFFYSWPVLEIADEAPPDVCAAGTASSDQYILDVYRNRCYAKPSQRSGGTGPSNYNREHTWPKSYGFSDPTIGGQPNPPHTDFHMLHLSASDYNGSRGNKPFDNCTSGCSALPTDVNNGVGGNTGGNNNYSGGSDGSSGSFQVWDHMKGNMARAVMYMAIRYEGGTHPNGQPEPDLELTSTRSLIANPPAGKDYMGILSTLLDWHVQDPVDDRERERNEVVYEYQRNRNPFVDHPEWATLALFTSSPPASCELGGGDNQPPVANDAIFTLPENSEAATVVGTIIATDPDVGTTLTYELTAGNLAGAFTLSGNQLRVANVAALDFETTPQFVLTVTVSDGALPTPGTDTATITVNLSNLNEPPVANDSDFELTENSTVDTLVGTVSASDPDAGTTLSYQITAGNGAGAFRLNGNQILVDDSAPLDFETTPQFVLTVSVSDGSLSDTAQITIDLSDANDAPTVALTLSNRSAQEGVAIAPFSVAPGFDDQDAGDELEYSALNLPAGLSLDAVSGQISGTPGPGTASLTAYVVTIIATDEDDANTQQSFEYTITSPAPVGEDIFEDGFEG